MRSGLRRLIGAVALIAAFALTATGAGDDSARPRDASGVSTLWRKGQTVNVSSSTEFREGDIIRVPEGSRLTTEFSDGASISLVGPSALRFGPMNALGRRVVLGSGAASEVIVHGIALEVQAPNPYDASLVLQNSRGFARVNPGDRIVFQRLDGEFAKVWREGHFITLGSAPWILNVRDGSVGNPHEKDLGDDSIRVMLNGVEIVIRPASQFSRQYSADGGLNLQFVGSGDSFGEVDVGEETSVYVYEGQRMGFDSSGDITLFEGVSHLQRPLFEPAPQDDPIENAADASPSFSHKR